MCERGVTSFRVPRRGTGWGTPAQCKVTGRQGRGPTPAPRHPLLQGPWDRDAAVAEDTVAPRGHGPGSVDGAAPAPSLVTVGPAIASPCSAQPLQADGVCGDRRAGAGQGPWQVWGHPPHAGLDLRDSPATGMRDPTWLVPKAVWGGLSSPPPEQDSGTQQGREAAAELALSSGLARAAPAPAPDLHVATGPWPRPPGSADPSAARVSTAIAGLDPALQKGTASRRSPSSGARRGRSRVVALPHVPTTRIPTQAGPRASPQPALPRHLLPPPHSQGHPERHFVPGWHRARSPRCPRPHSR